jgi:hypothetical protein
LTNYGYLSIFKMLPYKSCRRRLSALAYYFVRILRFPQVGEKPVTAAIAESVMSKQIDELEPKLTRNGYDVRGLAEQFHAKPAEIKLLFRGQLDPTRTKELTDQMLMAGLPI